MAIRLPSHLHRNRHGTFGFRIVVPRDLRGYLPQTHYRLSLFTTDRAHAARLALGLTTYVLAYFTNLRRMDEKSAQLLGPQLADQLAAERERLSHEFLDILTAELKTGQRHKRLTGVLRRLLKQADQLVELVTTPEVQAHPEKHQPLFREALRLNGLVDQLAPRLMAYLQERSTMEAQRSAFLHDCEKLLLTEDLHGDLQRQLDRQRAEHEAVQARTIDIATQAATRTVHLLSSAQQAAPAPVPVTTPSAPISTVIEEHCRAQVAEQAWTPKTEYEVRSSLALWLRIVGDQPIRSYGHEQHRTFKTTLQSLPANINKKPRYRGKTIEEIISLGDPPAAPNTVNKTLIRIASLFEWAVRHGYATSNPARGMTMRNPKRASEERQAFSREDLHRLFDPETYAARTYRAPYMYWTPLIALYTGARLNEIAQLHLADFAVVDGIDVMSINDAGDTKTIKTKAGKRLIPVHLELRRLGLLGYVAKLQKAKQSRLFPELKRGRDGYGVTVSKWFARFRTKCGITERGKVFHSFRHTVTDHLKQSGVPRDQTAALLGHESDDVTYGRYGKDFRAGIMADVVAKLTFEEYTRGIRPFVVRR